MQVLGAQADQGLYTGKKYMQEWSRYEHAEKKIAQLRSGMYRYKLVSTDASVYQADKNGQVGGM